MYVSVYWGVDGVDGADGDREQDEGFAGWSFPEGR